MSDLTLLTLQEAATRLRCSISFIRQIVGDGSLAHLRIGKRFMVTAGDLDEWVRRARHREVEQARPRSGKVRGNRAITSIKTA